MESKPGGIHIIVVFIFVLLALIVLETQQNQKEIKDFSLLEKFKFTLNFFQRRRRADENVRTEPGTL